MPRLAHLLPCLAAAMALGPAALAPAALAQDAAPLTAAQSASLDRAIRLWTTSPAGDRADAAQDYTVVPEGDHYRLTKPMRAMGGFGSTTVRGGDLSATVRPTGNGAWQFDDVRAGSPIEVTAPFDPPGGAAPSKASASIDLHGQTGRALIDPSLATQSVIDGAAAGATGSLDVPPEVQGTLQIGPITSHVVWTPAGDGRIDSTTHAEVGAIAIDLGRRDATDAKGKVGIAVRDVIIDGVEKGFSLDQWAAVTVLLRERPPQGAPPAGGPTQDPAKHAGTQQDAPPAPPPPAADNAPGAATPSAPPPPAPAADVASPAARPGLTPEERRVLREAVREGRGVMSAFDAGVAMDDVRVVAAGHTVRLQRIAVQEGIAAPADTSELHLRIAMEGLASSDLPPAVVRDYLPHRIMIAPRVSGLPNQPLYDLLMGALADGEPDPARMRALGLDLLKHGPVGVNLDEVSFDLGPASLHAVAAFRVSGASPDAITGSADIDATGLDALIKRAGSDPLLKRGAPVLIFLKGIGEQRGGTVHWKVDYQGGKVSVNGTDLSQLSPR